MENIVLETNLEGINPPFRGKVRDVYDLGDTLLIVATDRISAYDCVMPNGIPGKGEILTAISLFWFQQLEEISPNHLVETDARAYPDALKPYADLLQGRSMLVKKANRIDIECVVRGYLSGSGWKDYLRTGAVCGISLPEGLTESARLEQPIFTPASKADVGHDENISFETMKETVPEEQAEFLKEKSIEIYQAAESFAAERGIIIADTKFEFGLVDGSFILIDEVLTPDSSRFWPQEEYEAGRSQRSFDKQFVRDYLEGLDWDKTPPAPALPDEIVQKTRDRYIEACQRLGIGDVI